MAYHGPRKTIATRNTYSYRSTWTPTINVLSRTQTTNEWSFDKINDYLFFLLHTHITHINCIHIAHCFYRGHFVRCYRGADTVARMRALSYTVLNETKTNRINNEFETIIWRKRGKREILWNNTESKKINQCEGSEHTNDKKWSEQHMTRKKERKSDMEIEIEWETNGPQTQSDRM